MAFAYCELYPHCHVDPTRRSGAVHKPDNSRPAQRGWSAPPWLANVPVEALVLQYPITQRLETCVNFGARDD